MMIGPNYTHKLSSWKKSGFDLNWLLSLNESPATSHTCGLSGHASTSIIKELEYNGGLRRGKIQPNHMRLWMPGPQFSRWAHAAETILATTAE